MKSPLSAHVSMSIRCTSTLMVAVVFLVCPGLPLGPGPCSAEFVDSIAAAVNAEVITTSELASTLAMNRLLGGGSGEQRQVEAETLEGLITRRLLIQEARRLRFVDITDQEIAAEFEKLKKRFDSDRAFNAFLENLDLTAREMVRIVGERIVAERFMEKKIGLFIRVSREEALAYYNSHRDQYPGRQFADVQKTIISLLAERKIDQQLDQYLVELRSKADIRVMARPQDGH